MRRPLAAGNGRTRAPLAMLIIFTLSVLAWAVVGAIAVGIWAIF